MYDLSIDQDHIAPVFASTIAFYNLMPLFLLSMLAVLPLYSRELFVAGSRARVLLTQPLPLRHMRRNGLLILVS